jgi:membrane complex biogenesis BtpA family protein
MTCSSFLQGRKALIGMVHLPALPGSTSYTGVQFEEIVAHAVADARALDAAGFDAAIIQNTHDLPATATAPIETVAFLTAVGRAIREAVRLPLGVNVLKNDAEAGLAIAAAVGAEFVRLKVYVGAALGAEGVIEPSAPKALRMRQRLGVQTELWADLFDRTSAPLVPQTLAQLAEWAMKFGDASALIVTGASIAESVSMVREVHAAYPEIPVLIGGGVTHANVAETLRTADAVVVGSALEERPFTGPVSAEKAREFVRAARAQ